MPVIVDMHIHTMVSSPCSVIDPVECIERAIDIGLDAVVITEHDTLEGARVVKEMAADYPDLKVLVGMEVMSRESHLLIYGYDEDIGGVPPASEVVAAVASAGGIVVPAHPWRQPFGWFSGVLEKPLEETEFPDLFDVIEMYNGQQTVEENKRGEEYCKTTGAFGIGGSDAHVLEDVGCVITEFEEDIEDERHLVELLKSGRYRAKLQDHYYRED